MKAEDFNEYPEAGSVVMHDGIPRELGAVKAMVLQVVALMMWDCAETVIETAATMRLGGECRKISRELREMRRRWDQARSPFIDDEHCRYEERLAESFRAGAREQLSKQYWGLRNELKRGNYEPEREMLLMAVQQALTMCEALKHYCDHCDAWVKHYTPDIEGSLHKVWHRVLAEKLARYAGTDELPTATRDTAARILSNYYRRFGIEWLLQNS